jgi:hypothetical protein
MCVRLQGGSNLRRADTVSRAMIAAVQATSASISSAAHQHRDYQPLASCGSCHITRSRRVANALQRAISGIGLREAGLTCAVCTGYTQLGSGCSAAVDRGACSQLITGWVVVLFVAVLTGAACGSSKCSTRSMPYKPRSASTEQVRAEAVGVVQPVTLSIQVTTVLSVAAFK